MENMVVQLDVGRKNQSNKELSHRMDGLEQRMDQLEEKSKLKKINLMKLNWIKILSMKKKGNGYNQAQVINLKIFRQNILNI